MRLIEYLIRLVGLIFYNVLVKHFHQVYNNFLSRFCFFTISPILLIIIQLSSNQLFTIIWFVIANFYCLSFWSTKNCLMYYKNIEVSVLFLMYIIISELIVWILVIVYIFLIINNII